MIPRILLLTVAWILCDVCVTVRGRQNVVTKELYKYLLDEADYKTDLLPVCVAGGFVNVSLDIALRQIVNMNSKDQILTANIWVRMGWTDCRLTWNSTDYNDVTSLGVSYDHVWIPDIALYDSSAEEEMMPGRTDYRAIVTTDGEVQYNFPTVVKSICRIQVMYFPFDVQRCNLTFGSWSHSLADVDFYPRSAKGRLGDLSNFVINNEWNVSELIPRRIVKTYGNDSYTEVTYTLTMKRRQDFYVMTMLFPCMLVSVIAGIGFLLPPESGEKVSLEVTVLLSQAVFLLVISDFLPPSADDFPIMGTYFAVSMLLVSLSLILSVLVLNVHHRGDIVGRKVPVWARKLFLDKLANCFKQKKNKHKLTGSRHRKISTGEIPNGQIPLQQITTFNDIMKKARDSVDSIEPNTPVSADGQVLNLLKEQISILTSIDKHFTETDDTDEEKELWQDLARVLDRIFLAFYIVCFTVVTLVFMIFIMNGHHG